MKVAILSVAEPRSLSAAQLYTQYFENHNIDYDIICTDRYGKGETVFKGNIYQFKMSISLKASKIKKLGPFLQFRKYALGILKKNNYDLIVVWNENTMILFADYMLRGKKKYCVNIRDYDYSRNFLVEHIRKKVSDKALFTTIPSMIKPEFMKDYRVMPMISLLEKLPEGCIPKKELHTNPIHISYVGMVGEIFNSETKQLILALKNDSRFHISFVGTGSELLEDFVCENNVQNVTLSGSFNMSNISDYLNAADIVNANYGYSEDIKYLYLSNKMGYALIMNMPMIINDAQTTVKEQMGGYHFTFVIKNHENLGDRIYNWYTNLDYRVISREISEFVEKNRLVNKMIYKELERILNVNPCFFPDSKADDV